MTTELGVNASQMRLAQQCERRWWYQYIEGDGYEPVVPGAAPSGADWGRVYHRYAEAWLAEGRLPPPDPQGKALMRAIPVLPQPKLPGLAVEHAFVTAHGTVPLRGTIDFALARDVPLLGDHKTCSDLQWAKSDEELRADAQCTLYAYYVQRRFRARAVDCQWIYVSHRGQVHPVRFVRTDAEIAAAFEGHVLPLARKVVHLRTLPFEGLSYNTDVCYSFNRACPWLARCQKERKGDNNMSVDFDFASLGFPGPGEAAPPASNPVNPPPWDSPPAEAPVAAKRGPGRPRKGPEPAPRADVVPVPAPAPVPVRDGDARIVAEKMREFAAFLTAFASVIEGR